MRVRVVAFARLRELLGDERHVELRADARAQEVWAALVDAVPAIAQFHASTRMARNGALVAADAILHDNDEIALLPPVGGG